MSAKCQCGHCRGEVSENGWCWRCGEFDDPPVAFSNSTDPAAVVAPEGAADESPCLGNASRWRICSQHEPPLQQTVYGSREIATVLSMLLARGEREIYVRKV